MRFRLRLALAFLLLSALPLALLAVYSFTRSSGALKRAVEAEAQLLARDLEIRVGAVAADVDRRVRALARLPSSYWVANSTHAESHVDPKVLEGFAEALPFIENFRFVPRAPGEGAADAGNAERGRTQGGEEATRSWVWTFREDGSPDGSPTAPTGGRPRPEQIAEALRAAQRSTEASLASLPPDLPPAERARVAAELEKVRRQIGATLAMRYRGPLDPVAPAPPASPMPPAAPAPEAVAEAAPAAAPSPAAHAEDVSCPIRENGEVVGELTGRLKAKEILQSVLAKTDRAQGEIPFALDSRQQLFVADDRDGKALEELPAVAALRGNAPPGAGGPDRDWIVVSQRDEASGLRFGIARPISRAMRELKSETALNFLAAFFLIGLTTVGMIPLTGGLVKSVQALEDGAGRIANGDLGTRVPVTSRDEFGRLAASFNHMAAQLSEHQEKLLEQERIGKEREIARRLLEAENDRKSRELEEARRFQLSLLPRRLPDCAGLEIGVAMSTATEVGGDYYDFRDCVGGALRLAIGDATGHGAAAGTMVTVVKSLFMAATDAESPAAFLKRSTGLVHGMGLSRMAMALAVAEIRGQQVSLSSAGMPPALHFRAVSGKIEEIALAGMPLGARAEFSYDQRTFDLATGDALLLMSDGFPELTNTEGEVLGYERACALFATLARRPAGEIVAGLERAAGEWAGTGAFADDVTFLVVRSV